jgi:hypothetical protein
MRIIVATNERQGERPGDFCEADEGEIVIPVLCDGTHDGCSCDRLFIGVRTGKDTTTAAVVESDMSAEEYRSAISESELIREYTELGMSPRVARRHADELLQLARQFAAGAVIERKGDDFDVRAAGAGAVEV